MGFRPSGEGCSASRREALRWWGVTVSRRYSDFAWLHAQLCSHWPHQILPRFPGYLLCLPRADEDGLCADEAALSRRQEALQTYLRALLGLRQLSASTLLKQFLCPTSFYSPSRQVVTPEFEQLPTVANWLRLQAEQQHVRRQLEGCAMREVRRSAQPEPEPCAQPRAESEAVPSP